MRSDIRLRYGETPKRMRKTRIAVALFATAALCFGPAAMANADDAVAAQAESTESTASGSATPEATIADPAQTPEPVSAPETEADTTPAEVPASAPVPTPAASPAPAAAPAPLQEASEAADPAPEAKTGKVAPAVKKTAASTVPGTAPLLAPSTVKTPTIALDAPPCLPEGYGEYIQLTAQLGDLASGEVYTVALTKDGAQIGTAQTFTAGPSGKRTVSFTVTVAGDYTVTVTGPGDSGRSASDGASVQTCKPDTGHQTPTVALSSEQLCLATDEGSEFAIEVSLTTLETGEEYLLTVTGPGMDYSESFDAEGPSRDLTVNAEQAGTFTATIIGPAETQKSSTDEITVMACPPDNTGHLTPTVALSSEQQCLAADEGSQLAVDVSLASLEDGGEYTLAITGPGMDRTETFTAEGPTKDLTVQVEAAGTFTATIAGPGDAENSSSTESIIVTLCDVVVPPCTTGGDGGNQAPALFSERMYRGVFSPGEIDMVHLGGAALSANALLIADEGSGEDCGPAITATIGQCNGTGEGSTPSAVLSMTGLDPDESYDVAVTGPGGFSWSGSVVGSADGTASTTVALGGVGSYEATVGGDAASTEFVSATSCATKTPPEGNPKEPVKKHQSTPTKPVVDNTPGLPETGGSSGTEQFAWLALLALLTAAGLMVAPALRRHMKR